MSTLAMARPWRGAGAAADTADVQGQRVALQEVLTWMRRTAAQGGTAAEPQRSLRGPAMRARDSRVVDPTRELMAFRRSGRTRHAPTAFVPNANKRIR